MTKKNKYGRTPEDPIQLGGIKDTVEFLNNLVTKKGYHIIYHRQGSMSRSKGKPVDIYEIMTTDKKFDVFYIDIYSKKNLLVPPNGYLFEYKFCFDIDVDFDEKYKYIDKFPVDMEDLNSLGKYLKKLPLFERHISESIGITCRINNFPYALIKELYKDGVLDVVDNVNDLIRELKAIKHLQHKKK